MRSSLPQPQLPKERELHTMLPWPCLRDISKLTLAPPVKKVTMRIPLQAIRHHCEGTTEGITGQESSVSHFSEWRFSTLKHGMLQQPSPSIFNIKLLHERFLWVKIVLQLLFLKKNNWQNNLILICRIKLYSLKRSSFSICLWDSFCIPFTTKPEKYDKLMNQT